MADGSVPFFFVLFEDYHVPVLARQVVDALVVDASGTFVDATMGGGGHTEILQDAVAGHGGRIIAFDRDPAAHAQCERPALAAVAKVESGFAELDAGLDALGIDRIDGILYDLGVSSRQLDDPDRGFSYRFNRALDMRMDPGLPLSAADVLNTYAQDELERMFFEYGEVTGARRLVRSILKSRDRKPLVTTGDLVEAAGPVLNPAKRNKVLAQVFQAVRIEVNAELEQLAQSLEQALGRLNPGGRIAVISYHSLEDRLVKRFFRENARGCVCPPRMVACQCGHVPVLKSVGGNKPVVPDGEECARNERARSARLRVAEKLVENGNG